MRKDAKTLDVFQEVLKALLDETQLFDREAWAKILGVPIDRLASWTTGESWPRPDHLWMIINVLEGSDLRDHNQPLIRFREIATLPTTDISRHGAKMLPTLAAYMDRSGVDDFIEEMRDKIRERHGPDVYCPDRFSACLRALFDETGLLPSRQDWAVTLRVPVEKIEDWIAGRKIPTSDRLWVLLRILETRKINPAALLQFRLMALEPAADVSINGQWMLPTVDDYLRRQALPDFIDGLKATFHEPAEQQSGAARPPY
jgi:DNA-binding transcriptional regulator YiaG